MIFDEQIELWRMSYTIREGKTTERVEGRRAVWAARKSATRTEFYKSAQAGRRTDAVFCMHSVEYDGEQCVRYRGEIYDVVRTYGAEKEEIELSCQRRDGR